MKITTNNMLKKDINNFSNVTLAGNLADFAILLSISFTSDKCY